MTKPKTDRYQLKEILGREQQDDKADPGQVTRVV